MTGTPGWLAGRVKSFRCAFRGIGFLIRSETHARVHLLATALVLAIGLVVHLSRAEWSIVVLAVGLVWTAEALNTAIENMADALHPEQHPGIGTAKDVAAAGVLITSFTAICVAGCILLPRILSRL